MVEIKGELWDLMKEKGVDPEKVAESMGFDARLLRLYLTEDDYPIPGRIVKKIREALEAA